MRALRIAAILSCCLFAGRFLAAAQVADQPQSFTGPYRVAGVVVSKLDGHPLAQARIVLADTKSPQSFQVILTSEDGRFDFATVPAGKFSLSGAKRGFIPAAYNQHDQFSTAIVTGAGVDTANLVLKLTPNATISGKILDEAGEPVRHGTVTLYQVDHQQGVDQIHQAQNVQTDDLGAYEMPLLRAGTYYLSAQATPWYAVHPPPEMDNPQSRDHSQLAATADRSLDVAYPMTYYPDVTDSDGATPIPLRGGEHLQVDIHLNPVPALRLVFRVPGDGQHGYMFPQLFQHSMEGPTSINGATGTMVSPGFVEVSGIPAGRYDVRLEGHGRATLISAVDLSTQGQEVDASAGEALSNVKVTVQAPEDKKLSQLVVGLLSKGMMKGEMQLNDKGEAEIAQITPGRYEVVLFGLRRQYSIARISAEGAEVSGHMVSITAGSSPSIALTVVPGIVQVVGTAKRAGKPIAGAMVVLVPKDVEGNRDLFRRDQSDLDGTFTLGNVIPGSYTLVAIEDGWDLDWSKPEVITVYARHGRPVEIGNVPGRPVRVDEPIEVISK
jgi:Carboxypeptidase regulatory-like domain